uniref:CDC73_N domain-containing protein n=1 Tax=Heterorhabditis bacteriophora TaxID=37862 RepID=A0A1I7WTK7_HETBA
MSDAQTLSTRTHLGHLLNPGDLVLAFDIRNCNVNNRVFDDMKTDNIPDVVIVKKVSKSYIMTYLLLFIQFRPFKSFYRFMEDIEEDPLMREKINIYKMDDQQAD